MSEREERREGEGKEKGERDTEAAGLQGRRGRGGSARGFPFQSRRRAEDVKTMNWGNSR